MIVGLPKEIKDSEYRVGLTPAGVRALSDAGHRVLVAARLRMRVSRLAEAHHAGRLQAGLTPAKLLRNPVE